MTDENEKKEEVKKEEMTEQKEEQKKEEDAQKVSEATEELKAEDERVKQEDEAVKKQQQEEKLAGEEAKKEELQPGMTVRIYQKIKEGEKERTQVFQGIIIAKRGQSPESKTITVLKKSFGVRVEKIFPLASPLIEKIEVVKKAKVRRAKLFYLRDYAKKLKESFVK